MSGCHSQFPQWLGKLGGVLVLLAALQSRAFEVRGIIRYESYVLGATNLATSKEFTVEVDGCDWLIKTFAPGECVQVEKAFHQGDLFNLTVHCAQSSARGSNVYVGLIESDEIPDDDGSQINYLWLAYASACYLNSNLGEELRPVCCLDDQALRAEKFKMKSFYSLAERSPKLPSWVAYLSDGYYRVSSKEGRVVFRAPAPFDQGYTNAIYVVQEFTNCGAAQIPSHFEFTRFAVPRGSPGQTNLTVRTRIIGQTTSVKPRHSSTVLLPQFAGEFVVKDNRFVSSNAALGQLRYKIRDGEWLNPSNAVVAKAAEVHQQLLQKRGLIRAASAGHIHWFKIIWLLGLLGSLAVVVRLWFKSKTITVN